ncbi:hypothetical protein [Aquimarina rhabdastrellae]
MRIIFIITFLLSVLFLNAQDIEKDDFPKYKEAKDRLEIDGIFNHCFKDIAVKNIEVLKLEEKYAVELCSLASVVLLYTYANDLELDPKQIKALEQLFLGFSDKFIEINKPIILRKSENKTSLGRMFLRGETLNIIIDNRISKWIAKNDKIKEVIEQFNKNSLNSM